MDDPQHQPLTPGCVAAILPAAGRSRRFSGSLDGASTEKKVFAMLADRPVWQHAVQTLRRCAHIGPIIVAIAEQDRTRWETFRDDLERLDVTLCDGGEERMDSVRNGLDCVGESLLVAVHDAARPLAPDADVASVIAVAHQTGAALLATPVRATLKKQLDASLGSRTLDRREVWEALTPQVFDTAVLKTAYSRWRGRPATDDAQLVERCGHAVRIVPGSAINIKITQPEDLRLAFALLASQSGLKT